MQGGDQPATGVEPDLGWVSCSRVLQGGNSHSLGEVSWVSLHPRACTVFPGREIPGGALRGGAAPGDAGLQRQEGQIWLPLGKAAGVSGLCWHGRRGLQPPCRWDISA